MSAVMITIYSVAEFQGLYGPFQFSELNSSQIGGHGAQNVSHSQWLDAGSIEFEAISNGRGSSTGLGLIEDRSHRR